MKFIELVSRVIAERCRPEGVEGVRLSPLLLEPFEVDGLARSLRDALGAGLHLAVSAPGVEPRSDVRECLAVDDEAARIATQWRNAIDSTRGERIVYISHERWGKAGGLEETLRELGESDLRAAFLEAAAEQGLDPELARALGEARLIEEVSARALCEFTERVQLEEDQREAAGASLPLLGLARDSALQDGDAVARLVANKRLVHTAITSERTGRSTGVMKALTEAKRHRGEGWQGDVDLGEFATGDLEGRGRRAAGGAQASRKKTARRKKKRARRGRAAAAPAQEDAAPADPQAALLSSALSGGEAQREERLSALGDSIIEGAGTSGGEQEDLARLLGADAHDSSDGLIGLIQHLVDGEGWRLALEAKEGADLRAALGQGFSGGAEPAPCPFSHPSLSEPLGEWLQARRGLAGLLATGPSRGRSSLRGLLRAPMIALAGAELHPRAAAHLEATQRLYRAAAELGDASVAREVLALDTATIRASESHLTIIGPLHPLWLGQAMARLAQLREQRGKLSPAGARLIARAISRTPSAPRELVLPEGQEARLAPLLGGLICYEARPAVAESGDLKSIGERLVGAYLKGHPYARLGLRVRLHRGAPGALLEGLAADLAVPDSLARLEVFTADVPGPLSGEGARRALEEGRLTLRPAEDATAPPHIEIAVGVPEVAVKDERPVPAGVPSFAAGPLATKFSHYLGGLRAITTVEGVAGVEEFEALHAASAGWAPRGAFIVAPRGASLAAALRDIPTEQGTWRVVIGRGLAREVGDQERLLAYETREDSLTTAVVCDTTAPASRVLERSLRQLGVSSSSPRMRRTLADRLCETGRGLLAIGSRQSAQMASLLLEAALRRDAAKTCGSVTAVQLRGQSLQALADVLPGWGGALCLCAGLSDRGLQLHIGYAAVEEPLEASVARGGHLQGELADVLGQVIESVDVALNGTGVAQACALESLRWTLCPAAAEEGSGAGPLLKALAGLERGADVSVQVVVLLPADHPLAGRESPARLKGKDVGFGKLDAQLLDRLIMPPGR